MTSPRPRSTPLASPARHGPLTPAEWHVLQAFVQGLQARRGADTLREVTAFGSRARGDAGEESDLDVVALLDSGGAAEVAWAVPELAADTSTETIHLRPLSILPGTRLRPALRDAIERDGVVVYRRAGRPG